MEYTKSQRLRRSKDDDVDLDDTNNKNIPLFSKPNKTLSHSTYTFFTSSSYPSTTNPKIPKSPSGRVRRSSNTKKVPFIFDSDDDSSDEMVKLDIQEQIHDVPDVIMSDDEDDNEEVKGINDNWKSKQKKIHSILPPTPPRLPPNGFRPRAGRNNLHRSVSIDVYSDLGKSDSDSVKSDQQGEEPSPLRIRRPQIKKIGRPIPKIRSSSVPAEVEQPNKEEKKDEKEKETEISSPDISIHKKRRRRSRVKTQDSEDVSNTKEDEDSILQNKKNEENDDELAFSSLPQSEKTFSKYTISLEIESKLPKYRAQVRIFKESDALYSVKFKGKIKDETYLYVDQGKNAHISGEHRATIDVTNNKFDFSLHDGMITDKEILSINVVNEDKVWCYVRGISDFTIPLKGIMSSDQMKDMQEVIFRHSKTHEDLITATFLTNQLIDITAYDKIGPLRLLAVGISLFQMKDCF